MPFPHQVLAASRAREPGTMRGGGPGAPPARHRPCRGMSLRRGGRRAAGPVPGDGTGCRRVRDRLGTRERILYEASNLFARQGYHGTTTRQIAVAVGVRQPSLFHHFPSKRTIVQALLSSDLDEALPFAEALAGAEGPAAVRLHRYLRHDVAHLIGSPYNLSGIYTEEVMGDSEFAPWERMRSRLHWAVERIV